ncbi:hypothetical protein BGZ72_009504 [Mortierella alpina]|nr:hypothetical protein BGZ72_009504 [Mortierella alpina]
MASQDIDNQTRVSSDMEVSSGEEDTIYHTTSTPSALPTGGTVTTDSMKNGTDFIAFEFSDDEGNGNLKGHIGQKRKRSPNHDSEDDLPAFPEGCPWMGRTIYSDMKSVPVMLTQELKDFVQYISPTDEEHKVRHFVVKRVEQCVRAIWPDARVAVFGSFETKLYLPTSDMDMVVFSDRDVTKQDLYTLATHFRAEMVGMDVRAIVGARVPLVKFKETATGIPVDISFNITSGIQTADVVRGYLEKQPGLRSLTMIIKHFLTLKGHNEVFLGGVGSYTTILMIVSFLQMHPRIQGKMMDAEENLGVLLIEFFELYGMCFNYNEVGIAVTDGGSYFDKKREYLSVRSANRGTRQGQGAIFLRCIDPNDADNDTAAGSHNLRTVRKAFVEAYVNLTENVRRRDRNLFGPQNHGDRRSGGKGRRRGVVQQVSLIENVLAMPYSMLQHRRHIKKVFYEGTLQRQLGASPQAGLAESECIKDQDIVADRARERQKELAIVDSVNQANRNKKPGLNKVVAPRIAPLRDVQFIHADDSEEEDGAYFENLMKQGEAEYGNSDQDDAEDGGGSKHGVSGHNNPGNVNSSESSISLPQLTGL